MTYSFLENQDSHFRSYLGRYIKQKRQGLAKTSREVAAVVGCTETTYRRLESGRSKFGLAVFESLYSLLGLDFAEIIEISRIAKVAQANEIAKELAENYPA